MFIDLHAYLVSKVIIYIILVRKLHKNPRHILKTHIYAEFNQMLMFFDYHTELILKDLNVFFLFHLHVYEEYTIGFQESK